MGKIIFYLAGKFGDRRNLHQKMNELEELGFENSFDWTQVEQPVERPVSHLTDVAEKDIRAIHQADLIVAIMDDLNYPYRGTFTEIGAGLALDKPIILVCPDPDNSTAASNVFFHHPHIYQVSNWEEAKGCLDIIRWYKNI